MTKILTTLILAFAISFMTPSANAQKLSKEGLQQKAIHDFLFDSYIKDREAKFAGKDDWRGLKEVTVFSETKEVRHNDELTLPEGSEKVAVMFRHFAFHGEDLDKIKDVIVYPFSKKSPPRSQQLPEFYRVQMPSLPLTDKPFDTMKIRVRLHDPDAVVRVNKLVFIAQKLILPTFDDIPYRDLGAEFPRQRVEIDIDTDHELSIGGTADLQRTKWFRTHETPGVNHSSFEEWTAERNFLPGRGILKFNPALTKRWGNKETLKERKDKPGAADLTFFERNDMGERISRSIPEFQKHPYALCLNDWPEFMSVKLEGRGTPLPERFDDAADLAAAYVESQLKDAGFTAEWIEVKNESTIKSEWAHHWKEKQGIDGWGLLSDFHNRVADAIHARAPNVKVGGPTSAWMQLQVQDFTLYRKQARFIKETRGHIDFFSHHFYENQHVLGAHARRGKGYSNYLLGRFEAILDMLRAHMHKVDNVLPILITESGSLQNGRKPSDNWLRMHAWSAYLNKSMQRPDQLEMFVPFVFLHMPWNPINGDAAFTPKTDRDKHWSIEDFEPTTVAKFFELWRDFDGRRLPVAFKRDWLDVVAVHDENRISLAITNMGGRQIAVDLSNVAKRIGASGAVQTRLNYHKGEVVLQPEHSVDVAAIPVDVNETTVIRLMLPKSLGSLKQLEQKRWYAHETALKTNGEPILVDVKVDETDNLRSAKLVLGLYRRGGLRQPPRVKLNGTDIPFEIGDAGEFSEFWAPLEASVPPTSLQGTNKIEVQAEQGTTVTSAHLVTTRKVKN